MRVPGKFFLVMLVTAAFPFFGAVASAPAADLLRPAVAASPAAGSAAGWLRICTTRDGDLLVATASPGRNGSSDILIVRLDPFDATILASLTLGGNGDERVGGMALDAKGRIVLTGTTSSSDFPAPGPGAQSAENNGASRVFVCLVDQGLKGVERAAAPMDGEGLALVIGGDGSVYVGGAAVVPGVPGGENGFVLRLDQDSLETRDALFIGGSAADRVKALAVNSRGEVIAAGDTGSKEDFPFTENVWQPQVNVDSKAGFVAVLDRKLARIIAATAINASREEKVYDMDIGRNDSVVVAGSTTSPDFPSTRGDIHHGGRDAFVIELSRDLARLEGARIFGGRGTDAGRALVSEAGTFIVMAVESDSPVIEGIKEPLVNSGGRDIDIFFLGPSLKLLRPASAGTRDPDHSPALALGEGDRVIVAGITEHGGKATVYLSEHDLY